MNGVRQLEGVDSPATSQQQFPKSQFVSPVEETAQDNAKPVSQIDCVYNCVQPILLQLSRAV